MENMEFNSIEELKEYMRQRAVEKTKFKIRLSRHNKLNTTNETLNAIYKASLKEIKKEIEDGFKNGSIIVHNSRIKTL